MNKRLRHVFSYTLAILAVLALWQLASMGLGQDMLPRPLATLSAFITALGTKAFWSHFLASAFRAASAMVLAWAVAFPLGVLMGGFKRVDALLAPLLFLTYPIPKIVLLPVFLLVLGLGNASKIGMISLILGYQVLVTTRDGVRSINPKYIDSIRSLGGGHGAVIMEALIPAGLPSGFTALRLGTGVSVAVLFFVESFATTRGLGYMIMDAWGRMDYTAMFVGILGMSLLGVALYELTNGLEKRSCAWRYR